MPRKQKKYNNNKENKKIKKEELDKWIKSNWIKGRL